MISLKAKGCLGLEPDNTDSWTFTNGFNLGSSDAIDYALFLSEQAHSLDLAIGLKNNADIVKDVLTHFDFAVVEECFATNKNIKYCKEFSPFIDAGKPVFAVEYTTSGSSGGCSPTIKTSEIATACAGLNSLNFEGIIKTCALKSEWTPCQNYVNGKRTVSDTVENSTSVNIQSESRTLTSKTVLTTTTTRKIVSTRSRSKSLIESQSLTTKSGATLITKLGETLTKSGETLTTKSEGTLTTKSEETLKTKSGETSTTKSEETLKTKSGETSTTKSEETLTAKSTSSTKKSSKTHSKIKTVNKSSLNLPTPTGSAKLGDWDFCSQNSQCINSCCSKQYSAKFKCTPGGSLNQCTGSISIGSVKLGDWEFCSSNKQCRNACCSKEYSDDGMLKCTPGGDVTRCVGA
ncbi:hypothetical protein HK096_001508 [Nowakowskiella sp. JEL0078]|nr:hypothetical protein HK096_001508 [Nowakowskiella sp. JEL0078]